MRRTDVLPGLMVATVAPPPLRRMVMVPAGAVASKALRKFFSVVVNDTTVVPLSARVSLAMALPASRPVMVRFMASVALSLTASRVSFAARSVNSIRPRVLMAPPLADTSSSGMLAAW